MEFTFSNPVELVFGRGKAAMVGDVVSKYGKKVLIVTSSSSSKTGLLDKTVARLKEKGLQVSIYDGIKANPLTTMVHEGAALARREGCDIVLGLGGGSAIDASKAIAFMAVNDGDVSEYIYGKQGNGALSVVILSTTAATGSEVNPYAVLTNPETLDKKGLRSDYMFPKAAIIDPELLTTVPSRTAAACGLDILFHSIESMVSNRSNWMTQQLASYAISQVVKYLPAVCEDTSNLDAWDKVAFANVLGGECLILSGSVMQHGMEHSVSGLLNVTHAEGLSAMFVPIMEFSYEAAPEKFALITKAFGIDISKMSVEEAAKMSIECVRSFIDKLGMTTSLGKLGVKESDADWLADNALKIMPANMANNPKVPSREDIKNIYIKSI